MTTIRRLAKGSRWFSKMNSSRNFNFFIQKFGGNEIITLLHASPEERENYEMDDEGIHWYQLDEDVLFESFEYDDPEPTGISLVFLSHPELNAAAVGRRLGISQSLMAQYINGTKKPSKERERMILDEISAIGSELQNICA